MVFIWRFDSHAPSVYVARMHNVVGLHPEYIVLLDHKNSLAAPDDFKYLVQYPSILTLTVAQPFWWINELWQALLIENVINLSLKHNPTPIGNIILWYCIILFEHLHDETCRDNDWEGYKEGNNACQAIADGHFGYKLFIKGSNITFSSFFSLRYSSFPFFSDDSSRGKRLRCSRAPLPLLRSSSWSSLLPPSYGRAALAFFLRYSVRAYGIEYLLVQTRYKIRILGLHPVCGLVQATNELG